MKTTRTLVALITTVMLCAGMSLTGCKPDTVPRTATEEQVDQQLADQVKTAFRNSPAFKFPDVQVASFKGRIQLSGFVQSSAQKSAAETIAKGIPNVVEVDNRIALKQ